MHGWLIIVAFGAWFVSAFLQRGLPPDIPVWVIVAGAGAVAFLAAAGGFVSWYFTRFVIDAHELRIQTGAVFRQTRQVRLDRIQSVDVMQPLAARILGLAELKVEAGGTAATRLRYLTRADAYAFRDTLVGAAHGQQSRPASDGPTSAPTRAPSLLKELVDDRDGDVTLVTIPPDRLILAALSSSEFLIVLVIAVVAVVGAVVGASVRNAGISIGGVTIVLPAIIGLGSVISSRLINQFNYRLASGPHGLKITRGLTSLTSQSVPVARIQGVRVRQPLIWRALGLYRLDIDVLGYSHSDEGSGENTSNTSTILLPCGNADEVAIALAATLPGFDPGLDFAPVPRRARWCRPLWWRGLGWASDERFVVGTRGLLDLTAEIVPHARVQSLRWTQGPWQRRHRLATVHVDTPRGPVTLALPHLDADLARRLAAAEAARSVAAAH